ncbi:MAG TPA: 3'-5' exonuclease, partial [Pseudonocardiaceae bacterium]|nr:3'-5' exonuclease [Pseudonocardiaceae bacterium]
HAMRDNDSDATRITIQSISDAESEAGFVVRTIENLLGGSSFHAHDSGRVSGDGVRGGLSFDDIAILYRTGAQARPLMAALGRQGLPFQRRSHDRLRDHPGVRALLPCLRAASDESTTALLRTAGQRALDAKAADEDDLTAALGLLGPLARRYPGDPEGFLAELALGSEVDTWDPRANRISLLTLHAAKGLEFPVVFVVGCADGLLPLRWPGEDGAEAEERRLFFVGVTRAQAHLYLSHPLRDERRELRPSPFLAALGGDVARRPTGIRAATRKPATQLRLL